MTNKPAPIAAGTPSAPDIVLAFETTVIPHTRHVATKTAIRELHGRYRPLDSDRRFKARALLIVGASGSGKTTALEDYMADFPDMTLEDTCPSLSDDEIERLKDADIRRIVYVEAPERTTRRALVATILGAFGYRAREHWNTSEVIEKIALYAEQMGTQMIFIDEGHHMVNEAKPDATIEVTEFIKSLLNRVKVQIVIAGLPQLLDIAAPGPKTAQLRRRLQPPMVLRPYSWVTRSGRTMFSSVLGVMEKMMELPDPSGLSRHDIAKRIYVATHGEIGMVSKYLSRALSLALARQLRSIDLALLGEVHASWFTDYSSGDDDIIDFDTIIEDSDPDRRQTAMQDNPFLCSSDQLKTLWKKGCDAYAPHASFANDTRITRLRGTGPAPYQPFGRGD
ncbi:TniB family NTP-binding protein [Hoeflea sp.]|uniref:TniB family NTP-binding protein n=1 Tax=Hoeflea sp. TaxID=1940281 RepID=UPI003B01B2BB